jgi:mannose-6-phosphate isomerase
VAVGDSILVRSGEVHAIDGGSLILEIQQNSDTTYRVYDWGRVGLDGQPRTLHVDQSLRSIDWEAFEPAPVRAAPTSGVIADCEEFRIRRVVLDPGEKLELAAGEQPRLLSVVRGRVSASRAGERVILERGANILVPYAAPLIVVADGAAIVLLTEDFV